MDNRQFEQMLAGLLQADTSVGTEAFRDGLLVRCLEVLDVDACSATAGRNVSCRIVELEDAELGRLAAAGDILAADARRDVGASERW